jgi:hypothetical protein
MYSFLYHLDQMKGIQQSTHCLQPDMTLGVRAGSNVEESSLTVNLSFQKRRVSRFLTSPAFGFPYHMIPKVIGTIQEIPQARAGS